MTSVELKAAAALVGLVASNTLLGTDLDDDDREFFEACRLLADAVIEHD